MFSYLAPPTSWPPLLLPPFIEQWSCPQIGQTTAIYVGWTSSYLASTDGLPPPPIEPWVPPSFTLLRLQLTTKPKSVRGGPHLRLIYIGMGTFCMSPLSPTTRLQMEDEVLKKSDICICGGFASFVILIRQQYCMN